MNKFTMGFLAAFAALSSFAAQTFYVNPDPAVGSDDYDGLAAEWDGEHGPIRTLANITNLVTATAKESTVGDTVYLAEGDYDFGSSATGTSRASVPAGTRLIGVGDKNRIRIFGSATDGSQTVPDEGAMRCLSLGSWVLVKGVTLCNGRYAGTGGAAYTGTGDFFVDCVFSNNYVKISTGSTGRGGALSGGTAIRCLFVENAASSLAGSMYNGAAWNCVFVSKPNSEQYQTYLTNVRSCTFLGALGGPRDNSTAGATYHNLLILTDKDASGTQTYMYTMIASVKGTNCTLGEGSLDGLGQEALQIRDDYSPVAGANRGIDAGSTDYYEANFPTSKLVSDQKYLDFNGRPRIRGAAIDAGACEADPDERVLVISDAQTGLTVTGVAKGATYLEFGETNTFTVSRNYSTDKLCLGITVNGVFFAFTGETEDRSYTQTFGYADPDVTNLTIEAVYAEHNDWYVDPTAEQDGNGYTRYRPRRTIQAALSAAALASGDVVHVAPGVYDEGTMAASPTATITNRVIVPAGVGLVSDEGPAVTAIEGFIPAKDRWGTTDPIRCVSLGEGAFIKGFTLRNGMASMDQKTGTVYGYTGGGVSGGAAIDCVISNCYAVRGGGSASTALIRCRVTGNETIPSGTLNPAGGVASPTGSGMYNGSAYDSWVSDGALNLTTAINSRFASLGRNGSGSTRVCNCYVASDGKYLYLTNSVLGGAITSNSVLGEGSVANTKLKFGSDGSLDMTDPTTVASAVDKGDRDYYAYPAAYASEAGKDYLGGQRIYNGQIDIGCCEYDWRGDYTKALAAKHVTVAAAGEDVTGGVECLNMKAGDTLVLAFEARSTGACSLEVVPSGEGTVTVTYGGVRIEPVGSTYVFAGVPGTNKVTVALSGEGATAVVRNAKVSGAGFVLFVR